MTKAKFFIGLGVLIMIGAFIYLMVNITVQNSPPSASIVQGLFCGPDETLKVELGDTFYDFSNNMALQDTTYVCVNASGEARDISEQFFNAMVASYLIPFLAGLGLFLAGLYLFTRKNDREATAPAALDTPDAKPAGRPRFPQTDAALEALTAKLTKGLSLPQAEAALETIATKLAVSGEPPLSGSIGERLHQLEEIHTRGVLTDEEYLTGCAALVTSIGKK